MSEQAGVRPVVAADKIMLQAVTVEARAAELRGVTAITATSTLWIIHTT